MIFMGQIHSTKVPGAGCWDVPFSWELL